MVTCKTGNAKRGNLRIIRGGAPDFPRKRKSTASPEAGTHENPQLVKPGSHGGWGYEAMITWSSACLLSITEFMRLTTSVDPSSHHPTYSTSSLSLNLQPTACGSPFFPIALSFLIHYYLLTVIIYYLSTPISH